MLKQMIAFISVLDGFMSSSCLKSMVFAVVFHGTDTLLYVCQFYCMIF